MGVAWIDMNNPFDQDALIQQQQLPAACDYVPFPEEKVYFDQLFAKADANRSGQLSGSIAVGFLMTSGLQKEVLKEIWNIADCNQLSLLRPQDFYIAMRLISMAQNGMTVSKEGLWRLGNTVMNPPR